MTDIVIGVENLGKRYRIRPASWGKWPHPSSGPRSAHYEPPGPGSPHGDGREDHIWALKDASFEVARGEKVGVIGRNGAGKTTLLKILSRITEPTEGRAEIRGRVRSLLEVGTGFHPELTGRENVYLNGAIHGMKRVEVDRKFDDIVTFAEVEKFIDEPVKHYSSGMYVRLAFAVAAYLDPEILLVDEVLAVGDVGFQRKCLEKMEQGSREGRTVLFVSHNMAAITSLCQRGIFLAEGRVAVDDVVDRAAAQYLATTRKHQLPVEGKISLRDHPGRRKKYEGLIRLTHCRLLGADQNPVGFFRSGDEARVAVGYEMTARIEHARLVFVLNFNDILQRRLFTCSNDLVGGEFNELPGAGEVQCIIPRLPLVPGAYTVTVACKVGGVYSDGVYEAIEFEVTAGDFFGTGRLPGEGSGSALVDHDWSVEAT